MADTTIYPPLSIGAKRRLAIFKAEAVNPKRHWITDMDWRTVRFATLASTMGWIAGFNGEGCRKEPVWYSQDGDAQDYFRSQRDAHNIIKRLYKGWFTDTDCNDTAIGVVYGLSHGRFLAGYRWTSNDERVVFSEVFDDAEDAAKMADEHARVFAELSRDDAERFDAAQALENQIENAKEDLSRAFALRNHPTRREVERDTVRDLIENIRANRETLETDFKDVL